MSIDYLIPAVTDAILELDLEAVVADYIGHNVSDLTCEHVWQIAEQASCTYKAAWNHIDELKAMA